MPSPESAAISRRVREVREDLYGEHGGPLLAGKLGMSWRRWSRYESGRHTIPATVILKFITTTETCPEWLLSGTGPKYIPCHRPETDRRPGPSPVIRLGPVEQRHV